MGVDVQGASMERRLASDDDVCKYLRDQMHAEPDYQSDPVLEYLSRRDFTIEPLETETAAYLVNLFADRGSADAVNESEINCWMPLDNSIIENIKGRLDSWGYDIRSIKRVNRVNGGDAVVEVVAERCVNPLAQIAALSEINSNPAELLDAWVLFVYNQHQDSRVGISTQEWAAMRDTSQEKIEANIDKVIEQIRAEDGIPGTQWAINQSGGVTVSPRA